MTSPLFRSEDIMIAIEYFGMPIVSALLEFAEEHGVQVTHECCKRDRLRQPLTLWCLSALRGYPTKLALQEVINHVAAGTYYTSRFHADY